MTSNVKRYCSRQILSNQTGPHQNLEDVVKKHIDSIYQKPCRKHNLEAFKQLQARVTIHRGQGLILDSCCGTAASTRILAERFPQHLVIGVDQSASRLSKGSFSDFPDNCLLLQANCEDIWRLCVEQGIHFIEHYILYPNPYPKSIHLKRRWHAHPIFPYLQKIAATTYLRSNWRIYLEEFSIAWSLLDGEAPNNIEEIRPEVSMSLFETKYLGSGQTIYGLTLRTAE